MHLGLVISALASLVVTPIIAETNSVFICRYGDDFHSEIECTLGDFNKNGRRPVRTLNMHLPDQKYLTSSMMPRIRAPRFIIEAPSLVRIAEDAFSGFEDSILLLKIMNGSLEEVPAAIGKLNRLKTLNLNGNNIRTLDSSLKNMRSVRQLTLVENRISAIDKFAFHFDLRAISLVNNRIRSLNGSLAYRRSVKWLFISRNRISLLGGEFDGMESLQLLDASWNNIIDIAWASLKLPLLEILDLSHNDIAVLGRGLKELPQLRTLDLSGNRIDVLEADNFLNLRNLQVLSLSENLLTWLDKSVFDCLTKLTTIDLSFNQMKELSAVISPTSANEVLLSKSSNVRGESANEVCDFRINTSLKVLNMTGNNWKCDSVSMQSILRLQKEKVKLIGNPC